MSDPPLAQRLHPRASAAEPSESLSAPEGLSAADAAQRLARDGPNELQASQGQGSLRILWTVLTEPMFLLLAACGAIYLLLGDGHEALMLLGFVFVVMGITFVQQRRADRSMAALRELASPRAAVLRGGQLLRIAAREVVCGDVVLLAEGDRVPADVRLTQTSHLTVDESLLTGESAPVLKQAASDEADAAAPEGTLALSGTLVVSGSAQGRVVATGPRSALGRIGASLAHMASERTPTQQECDRTVRRVAMAGLVLAATLTLAHGLARGDWLHGVLAGLTMAMALLPEELPVVLTIFMGLGAWRLAHKQVLVRSIPAIELLGATTVLCVDKTGTLTANRMSVRRLWNATAGFDTLPAAGAALPKALPEALHEALEYAVLASHRRAFDPMETAIAEAGTRLLADTEHLHADWTLIDDYPLSNQMLAMSRVWQAPEGAARLIAAKGSPEAIIDLCHLDAEQHTHISLAVARMASDGLRVLGVARSRFDAAELPADQHDFDFEFLGLIALEDPVRDGVPQALAECREAGIRVVMMTGDHRATALSVARQVGLEVAGGVLSGDELAALDDAALRARLAVTQVLCRVRPEHKLRVVQAFRAAGEVVAMTGDGVNDAPALKAAHIGVAMGARGTDVAREAASLVLLDDAFGSIVTAIRDGRRVFANLRRAVVFLVAVHVPIVGLSMLPVALGWPMLLMPVHILFLQLIIDPTCSVVFEAEPQGADTMRQPPRRPDARLFDAALVRRGLWQGLGLLALLLALCGGVLQAGASADSARAITFMVLVLASLALILSSRALGSRQPGLGGNTAFAWVALATLAMLGVVLGVPAVARLFSFAVPSANLLAAGALATALAVGWFEGVRRWQQPSPLPSPASGRGS